jgi:ankyrin repeat protein
LNPFAQNEQEKKLFKFLAQGNVEELVHYLDTVKLDLTLIIDPSGFSALHLAAYKNSLDIVTILCNYVL